MRILPNLLTKKKATAFHGPIQHAQRRGETLRERNAIVDRTEGYGVAALGRFTCHGMLPDCLTTASSRAHPSGRHSSNLPRSNIISVSQRDTNTMKSSPVHLAYESPASQKKRLLISVSQRDTKTFRDKAQNCTCTTRYQ
jgi:hypothetical protein